MAGPSLSDLQSYRARLIDALGSGAREVADANGERVAFRGISEIQRALATIDSMIAAMQAGRSAPNVIKFNSTKGT